MIYVSNSESQTISFASKFSKKVKLGSVIALIGNLGSGKTTFTKGFAKGLNIKEKTEYDFFPEHSRPKSITGRDRHEIDNTQRRYKIV